MTEKLAASSPEGRETRDISLLFTRICELGLAVRKGEPISRVEGAWEHAFTRGGNEWKVSVNGHRFPVPDTDAPGAEIRPFEAHVRFNGWPFAILNPYGGGVIGAGEAANEDTCIAALEAEIQSVGGSTPETLHGGKDA